MGKEQAVPNPLAREMVDAVQMLGLKTVFEPGKTHPKDWGNPGRVRVELQEGGGKVKNSTWWNLFCFSITGFCAESDSVGNGRREAVRGKKGDLTGGI